MVTCTYCGFETAPEARFCPKCGRRARALPDLGVGPCAAIREIRQSERSSPEGALLYAVLLGLLVVYLGGLVYLAASGLTPLVTYSNIGAYLVTGIGLAIMTRSVAALLMGSARFFPWGIVVGLVLAATGAASALSDMADWGQYLWTGEIVLAGLVVIFLGMMGYLSRNPA